MLKIELSLNKRGKYSPGCTAANPNLGWLHPAGDPSKTGQIIERIHWYHDKIIYLIRELVDGSCHPFRDLAEGGQAMVTYSDLFTFVIMLCAIITLVSNYKHKK